MDMARACPWWRKHLRFLLRIRPRRRRLHGSLPHRLLGDRLFEQELWIPRRKSVARSVAIGVFVGFLPLIGLQTFISIVLAYFLRANLVMAPLATLTSNPFTVGTLLLLQIKLGQWLSPLLHLKHFGGIAQAGDGKYLVYGKSLLVGSLACALLGGLLAYPTALWVWTLAEKAAKRRRAKIPELLMEKD